MLSVKQIVGGTLTGDDLTHDASTKENFVSTKPSSFYAQLYKDNQVNGCHVIKLGTNPVNDEAAKLACLTWPGHLQVGGGITDENALEWLDHHKASHVILTSWLFSDNKGQKELDWQKLKSVSQLVGKHRLIVDLSCRTVVSDGTTDWVVAMNKWQTLTQNKLSKEFLLQVSEYCDEFLIHAADVEGLCNGIDEHLVQKLGDWCPSGFEGKIVYAGGARLVGDLDKVQQLSNGKVDLTYGSSLDIFGGDLVKFDEVVAWNKRS
ncbi:Phosphoribosylformimino-5-aminoimidazole carboxamide ribotide isomerase [Suhomyces tanzawaensis NRRL Y-17324]|uniref:1-(5-phosphoribosyl)-5-[(5-phosphoribosylamino)methylideneamino] imidazole-4-carboxamide isomerase n=1 Tax=Suhomyces tanzawaensis NRRL Y-17324 TaxID=984487 RepID=A0A1E4SBV5_9ASCO|nr:Phosphoribosylformimino-5-aminoimidazole carboxamide ribotide isomerase [Suhomyces tanzawaensis NRRL Y-17324]ODV76994.1 Phosphoribosylformimino-5-aminoimidazole carboxamide ribotide isomerase [Suhomyces tanzawaensis NRRL Y-17324]